MKNFTLSLKRLFLWALLSSLWVTLHAQVHVKGTIVDNFNSPVIGASILQKGTTNGTISDLEGNFTLTVPENSILVFSYIGYITQEKTAAPTMHIKLAEDNQSLDEVIVVGYSVQKKSVVTGAISSVKTDDILRSTNTRPEQALQGKTSGVQVLSSSGAPGESMKIRVRGYSSNGNSEPLFIVDGLRTTDISTLEPNNIASMEVLKDGASAAIYGAEGGNGVILITTKSGKSGRTQIDYNFQYTIQSLGKTSKMMNGSQYLDYMQEAQLISSEVTDNGINTNWIDETFENAPMMKHNLSISGGNDKMTYLASLSYLNQEGIVVGDQDNYKRYSGMFNGSVQAKKWLKISSNLQFNRSIRSSISQNDESRGVISNALMMDPLTPVIYEAGSALPAHVQNLIDAGHDLMTDENGNYYGISNYVTGECINPLVQRNLMQTETTNSSMIGNIALDITPFKGFVFTSRLGIRFNQYNAHVYKPGFYYNSEMNNSTPSVSDADATTTYWQWENFASYNKSINKNNFTVMVGTAVSQYEYKTVKASGYPLLKDEESFADLDFVSSQAGSNVGGTTLTDRKASFFGRVNYDYDNKYLFEATLRCDGAGLSILPRDKRWGVFPAFSLGWVITRENWFPQNTPISYLKIRGSWGQNGSLSNLQNYSYASNIASSGSGLSYLTWASINASYLYPLADGSYVTAARPSSLGNYNLTWETSEQIDLGVDLRAFNDRLSFGFDYFHKKTKNLITQNTPALEAGNTASPINGGNVLNKGFEFDLGWRSNIGDFNYSINANLSTLHNEVTYLDPSIDRISGLSLMSWNTTTAFETGYPVWYFRGYKTNGLTEDGDVNIVDTNGDGTINTNDMTMIGSAIPNFTYGATLNMEYKGFDFTVFISGSAGNDILYGCRRPDRPTTNRLAEFAENRWSSTNPSAKYPSAYYQTTNTNFWCSDMMVFDGSYMKVKQLQLGYTFPKKLMSKCGTTNLRLSVSLEDFFTVTSYPGMDPEASASDNHSIGVDRGYFPNAKKVMFGASLSF